jgi:murein DD-endopeptidase MepM/ murein hydrolase activator NlpD
VILVVLVVLGLVLRPFVIRVVRMVRLVREPAPAVLPVPVEDVTPGDLVDTWGSARSGGRRHEGIDIFAPRYTPVHSATRGLVIRRGWNHLGGRTVSVLGPGGYRHYYAHLEAWDEPDVGDWVEEGRVLGYVGDSGNARGTPTHLHYGIYTMSGEAIDPYPLLHPHSEPPLRLPPRRLRR